MTSVSSTFTAPSRAAPLTGTVAPRFARQPATMETMSTRVIDHVTDLADQLRDHNKSRMNHEARKGQEVKRV